MVIRIELSKEQLQLLINALEVNFRFMMGQSDIVADLLAQCPDKSKFDDEKAWNRAFERYLLTREIAGKILKSCSEMLYGTESLPEDAHRLSDMWSILRNAQYNARGTKDSWDVRSHDPIQLSDWDLMGVRLINADELKEQ